VVGLKKELKTLNRIAIGSLVCGGFLLFLYALFAYFLLWQNTFLPYIDTPTAFSSLTPASALLTPRALLWVFCGMMFMLNGFYLLSFARKQEFKEHKTFVLSTLLSDGEQLVFNELKKNGGVLTQRELYGALGMSPVKMHRIIARLEQKGVIKAHPFGMTKKIVLQQ